MKYIMKNITDHIVNITGKYIVNWLFFFQLLDKDILESISQPLD